MDYSLFRPLPEGEAMSDKPLPRDIWYTEVFDGYGNVHVILIDRAIPKEKP
jgi:hypothetical protein